jgi:hypothetical protein
VLETLSAVFSAVLARLWAALLVELPRLLVHHWQLWDKHLPRSREVCWEACWVQSADSWVEAVVVVSSVAFCKGLQVRSLRSGDNDTL